MFASATRTAHRRGRSIDPDDAVGPPRGVLEHAIASSGPRVATVSPHRERGFDAAQMEVGLESGASQPHSAGGDEFSSGDDRREPTPTRESVEDIEK